MLNSYHKGLLWSDEITRGVEETLSESGVDLYIEYMDTKRQFNPVYLEHLTKLLSLKYRKDSHDVIIVSDNNAFNYFCEDGREIYGNTPLVSCGINYVQEQDL